MKVALLAFLACVCWAQNSTLQVLSEFTRVDPFGEIVRQDRGANPPRDILSPGAPRNAFSSLRIVVTFDKPCTYILDIGQNPDNAFQPTLYKERFEKHGDQWIPDGLEPVKLPYEGSFTGTDIPGQKSVTFWLDLWVDGKAPVDRVKVEPQLWLSYGSDWFTYPMEVRVLEPVLPNVQLGGVVLPAVTERSDAAAIRPLKAAFCSTKERPGPATPNARALIRRNVLQHLGAKDANRTAKLLKAAGASTLEKWCSTAEGPASGPEWYLRFRDSLLLTPAVR